MGYIGIMENKMETTKTGYIRSIFSTLDCYLDFQDGTIGTIRLWNYGLH